MSISAADVVARAGHVLFGQPLVTNTVRGVLVEAMVAQVLEPDWRWCAADFASWDFENGPVRLEIKQSAPLQSWNKTSGRTSSCSFDIAYRSQAWENDVWVKGRKRAAHLYVFAHHPVTGEEADHREPSQWVFYVVPTTSLPDSSRISLGKAQQLSEAFGLGQLPGAIAAVAAIKPPAA
ncbi:MAG: hypothetical protein EOP20_13045 [Hyphomicrobiales bacterium]|nr:MAG: hypothetical protein EOP20_13045 [Hyphomicrobiales bacterium]